MTRRHGVGHLVGRVVLAALLGGVLPVRRGESSGLEPTRRPAVPRPGPAHSAGTGLRLAGDGSRSEWVERKLSAVLSSASRDSHSPPGARAAQGDGLTAGGSEVDKGGLWERFERGFDSLPSVDSAVRKDPFRSLSPLSSPEGLPPQARLASDKAPGADPRSVRQKILSSWFARRFDDALASDAPSPADHSMMSNTDDRGGFSRTQLRRNMNSFDDDDSTSRDASRADRVIAPDPHVPLASQARKEVDVVDIPLQQGSEVSEEGGGTCGGTDSEQPVVASPSAKQASDADDNPVLRMRKKLREEQGSVSDSGSGARYSLDDIGLPTPLRAEWGPGFQAARHGMLDAGWELPSIALAMQDPAAAERRFRRALDVMPNSADLNSMFGDVHYFLRHDSHAAYTHYQRAIEADPEHTPAACGLATTMLELGMDRTASNDSHARELSSLCETWLADRRESAAAMYAYGTWLEQRRGDVSGAEECYRVAIEHGRQKQRWLTQAPFGQNSCEWFEAKDRVWIQARALTRLGVLLHTAHNKSEAAEAALEEASRVDGTYADAYFLHGKMLVCKGADQCLVAEGLFKSAIQSNKSHVPALFEYAKLLHHVKNEPYEAERMYRRCLKESNAKHADAMCEYALLLDRHLADKPAALNLCKRALSINQSRETQTRILSLYARLVFDVQGDYIEAEKILRDVLERDLNSVDALHYYGRLLHDVRRDFVGAERMYRRALLVDQDHVQTLTYLGRVVEDLYRDTDGAEALYLRALAIDSTYRDALLSQAKLLQFAREDIDGAEMVYKKLLEVEPLDRDALHLYGRLLGEHRRNQADAERMLKKALFVNNSHVECLCDYGRLLQDAGRNLEAENQYLRALQVSPTSELAKRTYATLLHDQLHNYDKAEELYRQILGGNPSIESKAIIMCSNARLLQHVRRDHDGAEALYKQAIQYGVLDDAAMKSYASLLLDVRQQLDGALTLHRKRLQRCPETASNDILALATKQKQVGSPQNAEGLLRLLLDTSSANSSHSRAAWDLAALLMDRRQYTEATQLYLWGFQNGIGEVDELLHVARRLQADDGEKGGGESRERDECVLRNAQKIYEGIMERDAWHAEGALELAAVIYRVLLRDDSTVASAVAAPDSAFAITVKPGCRSQRPVEGAWGQVLAWIRRSLQCDVLSGGEHGMFERVYSLGVQMEGENRVGDAAAVLSMVVEISNQTHGASMLRCARLLFYNLESFDAAADMYAAAWSAGVANVDMLVEYAELLETHSMNPRAALECYEAAHAMETGRMDLRVLTPLARLIHTCSGDVELALQKFSKALVICADALALQCPIRGWKRTRGGSDNVTRFDSLRETHRKLLVGYGDALRAKGMWREAEDSYLSVMEAAPEDTQARLGLMFSLLDGGEDVTTAQELLLGLVDEDVRDARLWFERGKQLAYKLGSLLDAEDRVFHAAVENAIRAFEKSATIDPQNSMAWIEMARLECCNNNLQRSRQILEAVLDREPACQQALVAYRQLHQQHLAIGAVWESVHDMPTRVAVGAAWSFAVVGVCVRVFTAMGKGPGSAEFSEALCFAYNAASWEDNSSPIRIGHGSRKTTPQQSTMEMCSDVTATITRGGGTFPRLGMRPSSAALGSPASLNSAPEPSTTQAHDSTKSELLHTPHTPSVSKSGDCALPHKAVASKDVPPMFDGARKGEPAIQRMQSISQHGAGEEDEDEQETWQCDQSPQNILNLLDSVTPGKSSESLSPSAVFSMLHIFNTPLSEHQARPSALCEDADPPISVKRVQNGNLDQFRRPRTPTCPVGSPRNVDLQQNDPLSMFVMSGQDRGAVVPTAMAETPQHMHTDAARDEAPMLDDEDSFQDEPQRQGQIYARTEERDLDSTAHSDKDHSPIKEVDSDGELEGAEGFETDAAMAVTPTQWGVRKPAWKKVGLAKRLQRALARAEWRQKKWPSFDLGTLFASPGASPAEKQATATVIASAALRFGSAVTSRLRKPSVISSAAGQSGRMLTPLPPRSTRSRLVAPLLTPWRSVPPVSASAHETSMPHLQPHTAKASSSQMTNDEFASPEEVVPADGTGLPPDEDEELADEQILLVSHPLNEGGQHECRLYMPGYTDTTCGVQTLLISDLSAAEPQASRHLQVSSRNGVALTPLAHADVQMTDQSASSPERARKEQESLAAPEESVFSTSLTGNEPATTEDTPASEEGTVIELDLKKPKGTVSLPVSTAKDVEMERKMEEDESQVAISRSSPMMQLSGSSMQRCLSSRALHDEIAEDLGGTSDHENQSTGKHNEASWKEPRDLDTKQPFSPASVLSHSAPAAADSHAGIKRSPIVEGSDESGESIARHRISLPISQASSPLQGESSYIRREQEWLAIHEESVLGEHALAGRSPDVAVSLPHSVAREEQELSKVLGFSEHHETQGDDRTTMSPEITRPASPELAASTSRSISPPHYSAHSFAQGSMDKKDMAEYSQDRPTPSKSSDPLSSRGRSTVSRILPHLSLSPTGAPEQVDSSDVVPRHTENTDGAHQVRMQLPDGTYYVAPVNPLSPTSPTWNAQQIGELEQPISVEEEDGTAETVFTALRGVAFRMVQSRADKHKLMDHMGKPQGVRQGQSIWARRCDEAGMPSKTGGWLRVTDKRFAHLSASVYVPLGTVVGEKLFVQVPPQDAEGVREHAPTGYGYRLSASEVSQLATNAAVTQTCKTKASAIVPAHENGPGLRVVDRLDQKERLEAPPPDTTDDCVTAVSVAPWASDEVRADIDGQQAAGDGGVGFVTSNEDVSASPAVTPALSHAVVSAGRDQKKGDTETAEKRYGAGGRAESSKSQPTSHDSSAFERFHDSQRSVAEVASESARGKARDLLWNSLCTPVRRPRIEGDGSDASEMTGTEMRDSSLMRREREWIAAHQDSVEVEGAGRCAKIETRKMQSESETHVELEEAVTDTFTLATDGENALSKAHTAAGGREAGDVEPEQNPLMWTESGVDMCETDEADAARSTILSEAPAQSTIVAADAAGVAPPPSANLVCPHCDRQFLKRTGGMVSHVRACAKRASQGHPVTS